MGECVFPRNRGLHGDMGKSIYRSSGIWGVGVIAEERKSWV